jgi:hypothetical protein
MWKGTPYAHIMVPVTGHEHMEGMKHDMDMKKDKEKMDQDKAKEMKKN